MSSESFLQSEDDLWDLIAGFRNHTWPGNKWNHAAHLAVATMEILHTHSDEVMANLRYGLRSYLESLGARNTAYVGYHETLTRFWVWQIRNCIARNKSQASLLETTQMVVRKLGDERDLWKHYYSFDVRESRLARFYYVPPDKGV